MKESLGDRILRFPWLSREEQQQVMQEVHQAAEWQELLQAVQSITPLLQALHVRLEEPMSEELLVFYLVTRRFSMHPLPLSLAVLFARLEAHLEADPAVRQRSEEIAQRLEELAGKFDALAHFELLTGRKLVQNAMASKLPAPSLESRGAPDRPAQQPLRRTAWRWIERAAFGIVALSVGYGVLFWWTHAKQPELERLGFIPPAQLTVESYRGEVAPAAIEAEQHYQEALWLLRAAYHSFLGLFPRYDATRLAQAESLVVLVVAADPFSVSLRQEAQWLLAKVRLLRHDVQGARQALQEVADQEGPYAEEARRLLARLTCLETPDLC